MSFLMLLHQSRSNKDQKGQTIVAFLGFVPIFIVCLFIVADVSRYFYLKNQVRIYADSTALAAAGAMDMRQAADNQIFEINDVWGTARANEVLAHMEGRISEDSWMDISITGPIIRGRDVYVIVNGTGKTLFGGYIGIDEYSANAVAHARLAVGVDEEW